MMCAVGGADSRPSTLSSPSVATEMCNSPMDQWMPVQIFSSSENFFFFPGRNPGASFGVVSGSSRGSTTGSVISIVTRPTSTRRGSVLSDWKLARTVTVSMCPREITTGHPGISLRSHAGSIFRSFSSRLLPFHENRRNLAWSAILKSSRKSDMNSCSIPPKYFSILQSASFHERLRTSTSPRSSQLGAPKTPPGGCQVESACVTAKP
mmetsp:Transcript_22699/g.52334  ORF Transcript_22699/g.52334 Transcript_22699/m.52334 type:complete len:208 (-) Transcript_22699:69-692(-)